MKTYPALKNPGIFSARNQALNIYPHGSKFIIWTRTDVCHTFVDMDGKRISVAAVSEDPLKVIEAVSWYSRKSAVPVFLVGGAVRDLLLGKEIRDLDFMVRDTSGAKKLAGFFHRKLGFHRPVLFPAERKRKTSGIRSRRIDTYRTARRRITVEIVPFRGRTLREDLARRDFTINTLVIPLNKVTDFSNGKPVSAKRKVQFRETGTGKLAQYVEDPLGSGKRHLHRKLIKTPVLPKRTVADDPLRMLRAVRLARELGFRIAADLRKEISRSADSIRGVSAERVRDEIVKLLLLPQPSRAVLMLEGAGLLRIVIPELQDAVGFEQKSPYHHEDLFRHSLSVMDRTGPDPALRLAALFHDLGKIEAERFIARDPGDSKEYYVYWGHQDGSAAKAAEIMKRLKFPRRLIREVGFLVQHHMINYRPEWKESTVRRLVHRLGDHLEKALELLRADTAALRPPHHKADEMRELGERISKVRAEEVQKITCPLDGHEIQKVLGIGPGKKVGEAKRSIVEAILEQRIPPDPESARDLLLKGMRTPNES